MKPRIGFSREMARKLLKKHGVAAPPVDVEALAAAEGCAVEWLRYPDGTSGESWREGAAGFIAVNRTMHPHRQRFTLAHELGHLTLRHHESRLRDLSFVDRPLREPAEEIWEPADPLEVEANAFAAELLMPLALFKKEWQETGDVKELARRYRVSEAAAWWRVRGFPMR